MIGILGSVDLLEHGQLDRQQLASVETIRDCGEQLLCIIDDMLEVSKIEIGMLELNPCCANLKDIFKKTVSLVEFNLRNKGLLLELEIDEKLPANVMVDQVKLRQVIINLLSNSIKFTSWGGIKITARLESASSSEWILITVADTGIGISPNKQDSIFDFFTQADTSDSRNFGGTGLGLYICKKLVDLMGGEIWVQSQEGVGTTFSLKIPLVIGKDDYNDSLVLDFIPDDEIASGFTPISVLLVEDNELNQKLVAQMLNNYGFEVITAANGLQCLNILQFKHIDIVLMDMQMPIMDGYEATRLIRENKLWSQIPVIAITANSMSGDREKCLACGCSSYLAKPFKSEALVREIKTYLNNKFIKEKTADPLSQQLITELLPEFLEMMEETLNDLEEAIDLKNLDGIKSISHGLKGTAGMYGFMQISELAALIEKAIPDKNYQRMYLLYKQIVNLTQQANNQAKTQVLM
jgi:CheY-like chemotaxis protein/anti-sigma regulatory factor (Ser/Thr protein kinase)